MVSIYWELPSPSSICRARVIKMRATTRAMVQPAKKPDTYVRFEQNFEHQFRKFCDGKKLEMKAIHDGLLPTENVILCLSFFALGLKMFIPLVRLALQKCLINAASTLSINLET